jgi:ATP-dependent Lon protease
MYRPERIALFPLNLVLFPGAILPLHIFEPRYKLMIGECAESRSEFGISLVRTQGLSTIGCTASILDIVRRYPDGRMDILTRGQSRYQIREVIDEKPFLESDVEYLVDAPSSVPPDSELRLLDIYDRCHRVIYGRPADSLDRSDSNSLAYPIAADLPLDLDAKQTILELADEAARQKLLLDFLYELLPRIQQLDPARRSVRGNDHGPN